MGIIIEATGASVDGSITSSIAHAVVAARNCIQLAGIQPGDIDLLINVGVYRDSNIVEPAMGALIQRELGISLDFVSGTEFKPALSFDLMNGACGLMNAVQAASASLLLGEATRALIVSSDVHPSNLRAQAFPYASVGAAMLLCGSARPGFQRVQTKSLPREPVGTEGYIALGQGTPDGRERMTIRRDPDYTDRLLEFAEESARAYARAEDIELDKAFLIASQPTPTFSADLARRLGMKAYAACQDLDGDPHTSALTLAYHKAASSGALEGQQQLLFVAAGAGLSSACAGYRP